MKLATTLITMVSLYALMACTNPTTQSNSAPASEETTEAPQADAAGYTPLFNGQTTQGWRNYQSDGIGEEWKVEDGTLTLTGKGGGDIITEGQYENFDLMLEWKISPNGNSGLFFHVVEADSLQKVYHSGPEIQILDNDGHPDGKIITHRAGDNYDLQACSEETVRPVGEWNEVRLVINQGKVEQWLNGKMLVAYTLGSPEWEALYQKSKFTKWPMYGRGGKGHIALQDHGDQVWFRNIRIKEL
ncbi:MAG: DUF1080 domain-containing protein [Bacteroidota bacterium]